MADEQENDDLNIDEDSASSAAPSRKGGFLNPFIIKLLSMVAIGIVAIIMMFVISMLVFSMGQQKSGGAGHPAVKEIGRPKIVHKAYIQLEDPFRQQLIDGAMIQIEISLGYDEKNKKVNQEITQNIPEIRDIIIKALSRLRSEYFRHPDALVKLEEDLMKEINRILNSGRVERIFFQEYTLMGQ